MRRFRRARKICAAAAQIFLLILFPVKGVQKLAERRKLRQFGAAAVLIYRLERKVPRHAVNGDHDRRKVSGIDTCAQRVKRTCKTFPSAERQFPAQKRRESAERIEKPLIRRLRPVGVCEQPLTLFPLRPEKRRFLLLRRQRVEKSRQQRAAIRVLIVHTADAVEYTPVAVQQKEIQSLAHQLQHKRFLPTAVQLIHGVQPQQQQAFA